MSYVIGNVALEQWAEFFEDTEGLSRELDEILSPGGLQNNAHLEKGSPLGGAVERSETEGGTTAAEAAAKTDPAAAARRQQYQTEITAALEAGDYPHALKLFKEFGNPNLRALNEVQTLKAFGDYAAAMGYDVFPENISTDEILAAFEESYQNAIENQTRSDIIIPTEELPDRVLTRRKVSDRGTEIIDKATYHKLTNPVIKRGGEIKFADEEWMRYLKMRDATAAIIGDVIILMPDPTITDVLEEVYHFYQNRAGLNMQYSIEQHDIMNEIDAKEYLIRVADKYKIPQTEMEETRALLESYKSKMENLKKAGEWID